MQPIAVISVTIIDDGDCMYRGRGRGRGGWGGGGVIGETHIYWSLVGGRESKGDVVKCM